jgi:hypothetical protein
MALALSASGCLDVGPVLFSPGSIAVGATTSLRWVDYCTQDGREGGTILYRCDDETPREVVEATVDSPAFEIAGTELVAVQVRALERGSGTVRARLELASGEERAFSADVRGENIERLTVETVCGSAETGFERATRSEVVLVEGAGLTAYVTAAGPSGSLATAGLPPLFDVTGFDVVQWTGTGFAATPALALLRARTPGRRTLRSENDAGFALDVEVLEHRDVGVLWEQAQSPPLEPLFKPRLSVAGGGGGSALCSKPATWSATVATPGACLVAAVHGVNATGFADAAAAAGEAFVGFRLQLTAGEACEVDIVDEDGFWPVTVSVPPV